MADFSKTFKKALETSAEAVSKAAAVTGKAISKAANASGRAISHAATTTLDNARFKMDELGTIRRRNEVIAELGAKMYELYLAGVELPADAAAIAAKVQAVDCELDVLRSEHNARKQEAAQKRAAEKAGEPVEAAQEPEMPVEADDAEEEAVPTINMPVEE